MDLLESENAAFCYMIRVDKQSERKLIELQKELGLKGKLIEKDDFHTTIRYIKTSKSPDLLLGFLAGAKLPILKGRLKGFDIFGQEKDALVLKIESKEITDWFTKVNKFLLDNNYPKSEYPIYHPHVTLTYDKGIEKPKWKSKYEMEIKFTIHVVSNKQEKLIFNKDATKQTLRESIVKVFMESPIWDEKHKDMGKFITDDGLDNSIQSTKESSFFKKRFRIGEYTI
jgi:2'-5' RNA ligase